MNNVYIKLHEVFELKVYYTYDAGEPESKDLPSTNDSVTIEKVLAGNNDITEILSYDGYDQMRKDIEEDTIREHYKWY